MYNKEQSNLGRLGTRLVNQIGEASRGPQKYTGPDTGGRPFLRLLTQEEGRMTKKAENVIMKEEKGARENKGCGGGR
jgi:hypothetical protein